MIHTVMLVLAATLALYFGVYLFRSLNVPFSTALAYHYTLLDSAPSEGVLVREEQVLSDQPGIVDVLRFEGERVGLGQPVAVVYRDTTTRNTLSELESMQREYNLLTYATTQSGDIGSAARLDEAIIQSLVSLRGSTTHSDYSQLEEQVLAVKSGVLKRGYTYGDGVTSAELKGRQQALKTQIDARKRQAAAGVSRITANQSGTFSHLVDGMESTITPKNMNHMGPAQLHELMKQPLQPDEGAVGKLITNARWHYASIVPASAAQRLKAGQEVTMRFSGDFNADVPMRVDHIGATEKGETAVVFSSDRYLEKTTLLRQQSAELIFDYYTGLRVPKVAVRMLKNSYTDQKTGQVIQANTLGVYVLVAGRTEFKEVKVLTEGSDYFVVAPAGSQHSTLRAGDKVITEATGLYEGQQFRD